MNARARSRILALLPLIPPLVVPGAGVFVSFAIVLLAMTVSKTIRAATLNVGGIPPRHAVRVGFVGGLAIAAFSYVADQLFGYLTGAPVDLSAYDGVVGNPTNFIIMLLVSIIIGGVLEELTFRGFVVGFGSSELGRPSAIWLVFLSAVVFGIAHLYQGAAGVLSTGLVGLLLGLLYLHAKKNVIAAIFAHATVNIIGVTLIFLGMA